MKTLVRLLRCAGSSEPLLFVNAISTKILCFVSLFFFRFDLMINVMLVIFKSFYHFHHDCFIILQCYIIKVWLFY